MASITLFTAATQATGQQLDDNLGLVSAQAPIPCLVSGTNAITLTQKPNTYPVTAYSNNMQLSGVASATNTTTSTAQLGSLGALVIYKDSIAGPVILSGGEITAGNAFTLLYDPTLNSGAGGWHLFTGTQAVGTTISPAFIRVSGGIQIGGTTAPTLSRYLTATASVSFSIFGPNSSQESVIALTGILPNDAIQVGPPSMTNQAVSFFGYVPASGSVALRAVNAATVSVTLASGIFRVTGMG